MKPHPPRLIRYKDGSCAVIYSTHREFHESGVTDTQFQEILAAHYKPSNNKLKRQDFVRPTRKVKVHYPHGKGFKAR